MYRLSCTLVLILCALQPESLLAAEPLVVELWPQGPPEETGEIGKEYVRMSTELDRKQVEVTESTVMSDQSRGLHILRGGVDVAPEVELQRDLADPERARGGHQLQRRDLPEIALERRRHQDRKSVV